MADAEHLKCFVRKGVWVRVPPPALRCGERLRALATSHLRRSGTRTARGAREFDAARSRTRAIEARAARARSGCCQTAAPPPPGSDEQSWRTVLAIGASRRYGARRPP